MTRKNKILLFVLLFTLIGCSKKEEVALGEIEIKPTKTETVEQEEKKENLYKPNDKVYMDKDSNRYTRKNIPEYGISLMIPEGFKVDEVLQSDLAYDSYFLTLTNSKGINISIFAKENNQKDRKHIQLSLKEDILNRYVFQNKAKTYELKEFRNGNLQDFYSDKDVFVSKIGGDYVEFKDEIKGNNYESSKQLIKYEETPQMFRLQEIKATASATPNAIINYSIVNDKSVVIITTYFSDQEKEALRVNDVVSTSARTLTEDTKVKLPIKPVSKISIDKKLYDVPGDFKIAKRGNNSITLSLNDLGENTLVNNIKTFVAKKNVSKQNDDVLKVFSSMDFIKDGFINTFKPPLAFSSMNYLGDDGVSLITSEKFTRQTPTGAISSGTYVVSSLIGLNIKNSAFLASPMESGSYLAKYNRTTGELEVVMVETGDVNTSLSEFIFGKILTQN